MKSSAILLGALVAATGLSLAATPAAALGGCGPNRHRNGAGYCVWGGQRQAGCVRHTGQDAGRGPDGVRWCR